MAPGLGNAAQRNHSAMSKAALVQNSHLENCLYFSWPVLYVKQVLPSSFSRNVG